MQSIKGVFKDGVVHPSEPISDPESHPVIITFLEVPSNSQTVLDMVILPGKQRLVVNPDSPDIAKK